MKTTLILFVGMIIIGSTMTHGQVNETFDGTTFPPSGWTINSTGGSTVWSRLTSNTKNSSAGTASSTSPSLGVTKNLTLSLNSSSSVTTLTYFVAVSSLTSGTGATLVVQAGTDTSAMTTLRTINLEDNGTFTANTYIQFTDNIDGTLASNQSGSIDLRSQNTVFIRWSHQKVSGTAASCRLEDVAIPNSAPLPVELMSFTAIAKDRGIELMWKTATEVNNAGFEIEKKVYGSWKKIGFVEGHGTINAPQSYCYNDADVKGTLSYRLKQIDRDGKYEYSNIVEAIAGFTVADFGLAQNYPNPFNPNTIISFAMKNAEHVNVSVFNALGQTVATLFNGIANPNELYSLNFNGKNLSSGTYFYALRCASRNEVRKMLLMK
ncbi:MAG: T9SS type A sorting domain-containing protein [Bacteroidota bacterium]